MGRLRFRRRHAVAAAAGLASVLAVAALALAWRGQTVAAVLGQIAALALLVGIAVVVDAA